MTTIDDTYTGRASPPPTKTTARPSVSYAEFVTGYTSLQRRNVLATFSGIALITGAVMRLDGWPVIVLIALGLGLAAAGAVGLFIASTAHNDYARQLGMTTATTYATQEPARPVRAFVASGNGRVIRRGRFALETAEWRKLYDAAARNGGRLTRDAVVAAKLPRSLYGDGAWGSTLTELERLGVVDAGGVITDDGWSFYETEIALPHGAAAAVQPDIVRPTGVRPVDRGSK